MQKLIGVFVFILIIAAGSFYLLSLSNKRDIEDSTKDTSPQAILFNGNRLEVDDEFNFSPNDNCVGDIKAQLSSIHSDYIVLNVLEEQVPNGKFMPSNKSLIEIKNGTCINSVPLCLDVVNSYCFTFEELNSVPSYSYEIESRSTMPKPPVVTF